MKIIDQLSISRFWSFAPNHLLAWSIFISYELIYLYLLTGVLGDFQNYVLNYTLNILLFYFNAHVLFSYTAGKFKGAVFVTFLFVILEIVIFVIIKYPINVLILGDHLIIKTYDEFRKYAITNAMRTFYIIGFSTAYWFAMLTIKRNREIGQMEAERLIKQNEEIVLQKDLLQSRNAYLQAQVNPHLLFNTLNFMYNASAKVSDKLAKTVMNLSEIMRYALTSIDDDDKVLLEKEIEHIHNYIGLNQARFDEKLNIRFIINGNTKYLRIIPLSLITLVENLFKYGDLKDAQSPAIIRLDIDEGQLEMDLRNKKRTNRRVHGHGTGIKNLRERLNIYYRDAHSLEINDKENTYELKLILTLNK